MLEPLPLDSPPFSLLKPDQRTALQHACAAATFEAGATLLSPLAEPTHAFIVAQGHVQHLESGGAAQVHGPGELLAVREVLAGRANGQWTAIGAVAAHAIPKHALQALIGANSAFSARLFGDIARRLSAVAQSDEKRELLSLMMVRIGDAHVRKPLFVDGATDVLSVCRLLASHDLNNVLVRDGERVGMFTTTDLREAVLRGVPPATLAVREVAQFALIAVHPDSDLFDALLAMVRHRVHRVLVRDGEKIVGVLSQLDLMSFVSNHSHIIALKIEQSETIDELRAAAVQMDGLVGLLQGGGVRVEVITALVSELNTRVFARLWSFIAPPELVENSCLVVMGSEGRGEQILKTDQDNALLLRDGFEFAGLDGVAQHFNASLAELGYPQCPGDIMITNPLWRQPLAAFRETIGSWLYGADPQGVLHLAIFLDAVAIAGDAGLLQAARRHLDTILSDDANFMARFARAADQFAEPGHWWTRLAPRRDEPALDLKKLGTFPIVHGARALALQYRIRALGTAQRIRALVEQERLPAELARDLIEALHFLMALKLKHQLRQRQIGEPVSNLVLPSALGTLERDTLKDSLAIIKRFRQHLHMHFRLGAV